MSMIASSTASSVASSRPFTFLKSLRTIRRQTVTLLAVTLTLSAGLAEQFRVAQGISFDVGKR